MSGVRRSAGWERAGDERRTLCGSEMWMDGLRCGWTVCVTGWRAPPVWVAQSEAALNQTGILFRAYNLTERHGTMVWK